MLKLISIDPRRDSELAESWINAPGGARMLQLMGLLVPDNYKTTISSEFNRLTEIVNNPNEDSWMIEFNGVIIGIVMLDKKGNPEISAPNVSIMIGDASLRGQGIGSKVINVIIKKCINNKYKVLYARTLTHNEISQKMLKKVGFIPYGPIYTDEDGLIWQNYKITI
jgi:RimJ/RimL family protein N-acetyltransferase